MPETLGQRIRIKRGERGWTAEDLAENALGSRSRGSDILKWETGRHKPSLDNLVALAQALSCSTDYLLDVKGRREEVAA